MGFYIKLHLIPGAQGSRSWATQRDDHLGPAECTLVQYLVCDIQSMYLTLFVELHGFTFYSLTEPRMLVFCLLHDLKKNMEQFSYLARD